jgi:hypothetical protein
LDVIGRAALFHEDIDGVDDLGDGGEVGREESGGIEVAGFAAGFADFEELEERGGIDGEGFVGAGEDIALEGGGGDVVKNEGVAEEDAKGGKGIEEEAAEEVGIGEESTGLLTEAEEFGAKVVFDLGVALDIVEFDGEAIGGGEELVLGEEERGGVALLAPPAEGLLGGGEFGGRDLGEDAEDVEIGEFGVMIAGGGGAIEDDGDEGGGVGAAERLEELG